MKGKKNSFSKFLLCKVTQNQKLCVKVNFFLTSEGVKQYENITINIDKKTVTDPFQPANNFNEYSIPF